MHQYQSPIFCMKEELLHVDIVHSLNEVTEQDMRNTITTDRHSPYTMEVNVELTMTPSFYAQGQSTP